MAWTDTGLKIWTLLAVDTLKPLLRNMSKLVQGSETNMKREEMLGVSSLTHLRPSESECHSTEVGPDQLYIDCCRTHTMKHKLTIQPRALMGK